MTDPTQASSAAQCCDKVYFCPTSGDTECPVHGGFDVCCDRPDLHRPVASAAMTHAQRNQLRHLIDQAKRRQLANHKPPPGRNQEARRATYRAYYQRNRTRILARRAASRAA